jgi:2-keto-4-pentenoate hydratase
MLMTTKANRYAHQLLKSRAAGTLLPVLTNDEALSIDDGYDIARSIVDIRIAQGETPIGRKIGFSNRKLWTRYGRTAPITEPLWSTLFDSTVEFAMDNLALHKLSKATQPRIEPGLVFKLARTPEADADLNDLADCLEWMANSFEVLASPYRNWSFEAADAIAAFGLHRALIIGEPKMLARHSRHQLSDALCAASLSLSRSTTDSTALCAAGLGSDVLGGPLHALLSLHRQLQSQTRFEPLQAGELIATGSWTDALPVKRGEVWSSAFSQLNLPGLNLSFG